MQILTLRIENVSSLENGAPISFRLEGGRAQVGRKAGMDWVLPDPTRHISGHHFDVAHEQGSYVLRDVSSNGTFLMGDRYKLLEPRVLQHGDRLNVGSYIIQVDLSEPVAESFAPSPDPMPVAEVAPTPAPASLESGGEPATATSVADPFEDVWGDFATPVDTSPYGSALQTPGLDQIGSQQAGQTQLPDLSLFVDAPKPQDLSAPPKFSQDAGGNSAIQAPAIQAAEPTVEAPPTPQAPPSPQQQATTQQYVAAGPEPFADFSAPSQMPEFATSAAGPTPAQASYDPGYGMQGHSSTQDAVLQAFLQGAGVHDVSQLNLSPQDLGWILGQCVRHATHEMMGMLQSRAAMKLFISGEDRTMRLASGNNPMKFLTDPDRAFEAMFLQPRDGYMTGADGFRNALEDIRHHQDAVVAALQPALAELLDGLSPEEVEDAAGGALVGGKSRKAWGEYKKRWEAMASQGENGALDAFIKAFSRHYSDALNNKKTEGGQ